MILPSTRYALISCRYLVGAYYENHCVSAPEIAERYHMDIRMLVLALNRLVRADILSECAGGFIFSHHPSEIRLVDVVTALEGKQRFVCCREAIPGIQCDCRDESDCCVFRLMNNASFTAMAQLTKMSLADHYATNRKEV